MPVPLYIHEQESKMEYRLIPNTDLEVSRFCLGTMTFGGQTDKETAVRMIHAALDSGVNFIDTADIYTGGASEEIVGKALEGRRNEAVLATKVGGPAWDGPDGKGLGKDHILKSIDISLKRLKTDCIDIYYMHFPDRTVPPEETIETMNSLIDAGKIRYYAVSNYAAWEICSIVEKALRMGLRAPVMTESVYNVITRGADSELLPFLREYEMGLAAYNPLAGGLLSGKHKRQHAAEGSRMSDDRGYIERYWKDSNWDAIEKLEVIAESSGMGLLELSARWMISQEDVTSVIFGASKKEHLTQNIAAAEKGPLDKETLDACDCVWNSIRGDWFGYYR